VDSSTTGTSNGRPARAGRTEHAAVVYGLERHTQEFVSARASARRETIAAEKAARALVASEHQERLDRGSKKLAHLEDQRQDEDDADDAEMRDPSAGYDIADAQDTAAEHARRGDARTEDVDASMADEEGEDGGQSQAMEVDSDERTGGVMHEVSKVKKVSAHLSESGTEWLTALVRLPLCPARSTPAWTQPSNRPAAARRKQPYHWPKG
jgi:hypothetical protein